MAEKGRWEVVQVWKNNPQTTLRCTECKTWQEVTHHEEWPYCPYCGAKMDGTHEVFGKVEVE